MLGNQKINSVNDIFQVTINSSKLNVLLKNIQKSVEIAKYNIQVLQKNFQENKNSVNRKIHLSQEENLLNFKSLFEKFKSQIKLQLRQKQQTYINNSLEKQQHIKELGYEIQTINHKITKNKDQIQQKLQNCVKQFSIQQFSLKRQFQKSQQKFNCLITALDDKLEEIQNDNQLTNQMLDQMSKQLKNIWQINRKSKQKKDTKQPMCFQQTINTQKYKFQKQNSQEKMQEKLKQKIIYKKKCRNGKSAIKKQVKKSVSVNYLAGLEYASISQKVNQLQKKISETQQLKRFQVQRYPKFSKQEMEQNFNRTGFFARKGKNNMMKTFSYTNTNVDLIKQKSQEQKKQDQQESFFKTIDQYGDLNELNQIILKRIQPLKKQIFSKNRQLQANLNQIQEKLTIFDQKFSVINKKNSKNSSDLAQLKIKLLHIQKKFHNDSNSISSISQLQNQFSKLLKKIDKQLENKINIQIFQQQKQKVANKLNIVQQNLIQKVDKIEVKKAFNFLQDKIKEIILVIANDFNEDKIGAINRVPFKCLTCDREKLKVQNKPVTQKLKNTCSTARNEEKRSQSKDGCHYYTRLLKSKMSRQKLRDNNYTTVTQITEGDD